MWGLSKLAVVFAATIAAPLAGATPFFKRQASNSTSGYWLASIQRQGTVPFSSNATDYKIYRNVKDYGAKGDGSTDDTAAINSAITDGNRCGQGCDSSTTTPALVFFPSGTYVVSKPIVQLYYTQFVGDATDLPVLKAAPSFAGMAVIDSDPYEDGGANWYTNQNNFYRQIRNFVIDLTAMPPTSGAGIHWQVAQATSLQNIVFNMVQGAQSKQQGIFMDNGSGGFMSDLVFNGGGYGAFFGNQQFTTRNLTFNNVQTAILMNWNWLWTLKSISVNNCNVGVNMSTGGSAAQTVGSVIVQDSTFKNTQTGILTAYSKGQTAANGTLIIDNVDFTGAGNAVADISGNALLKGGSKVASWAQGFGYTTGSGTGNMTKRADDNQMVLQGTLTAPPKPSVLVDSKTGGVFERSKPQYETVPVSSFISVKSSGAKGDGTTDDTQAIQQVLNKAANSSNVVYFDHGAYRLTSTIQVPKNIKMTGEMWPIILADGPSFSDASNPKPVFQVGQPGDVGNVEMSDLVFETLGSAPGAIMIEWNVAGASQGSAGMWDVHARIGGTAGTKLQSDTCVMKNNTAQTISPNCIGAYMMFHATAKSSAYLENNWFWVADHELDLPDHSQINIFNGRGVLIESAQGPFWAYGSSSEHSQLYNYEINNASNVYLGAIQSETPYYQKSPNALTPFAPNATSDPTFSTCTDDSCKMSWGLRIVDSSNVHIYGAGHYAFFDDYSQTCLATESCQENMVSIENCASDVFVWGLSTKAATNMVSVNNQPLVQQANNPSTFCATLAVFEQP